MAVWAFPPSSTCLCLLCHNPVLQMGTATAIGGLSWSRSETTLPCSIIAVCHADVQPVDPLQLWDTPPFEPTVDRKKDMLFRGRGVSDDKGGLMQPIHVRPQPDEHQVAFTYPEHTSCGHSLVV